MLSVHDLSNTPFNSVKGTNTVLWTCLGLSLIVSLTVFVLMFLLRKMNSEPSKDERKNTGWFDVQSLKSVSEKELLWMSVNFSSFNLSLSLSRLPPQSPCWVIHLVRALLGVLEDSCVKWTFGKERAVFFLVCLFAGALHSFLSNYSPEVLRFLWQTPMSLTKVSPLVKHLTLRNC